MGYRVVGTQKVTYKVNSKEEQERAKGLAQKKTVPAAAKPDALTASLLSGAGRTAPRAYGDGSDAAPAPSYGDGSDPSLFPAPDPLAAALLQSVRKKAQPAARTRLDVPSGWDRVGGVLTGAAKSTGAGYTNLGGAAIEGMGHLNTWIADKQDRAKINQLLEDNQRYRQMLASGRKLDGTALTEQERAIFTKNITRNERLMGLIPTYTQAQETRTLETAGQFYDKADELAGSAAQDVALAKRGAGQLGQFAVDLGVAGTQLAGDMAMGGLPAMFARSVGSGAQEARHSGAGYGQQLAYGLGSGALSVATEKISNVAGPFRKVFGKGVLDDAIAKATGRLGQTAAGRMALSALGEGAEEFVEAVFQPVLQRATFDPEARFNLEQALYDAAIGAALGGLGGGVEVAGNAIFRRKGTQGTAAPQTAGGEGRITPDAQRGVQAPHIPAGSAEAGSAGPRLGLTGTQNAAPMTGAAEPIRVGRVTTIQRPYRGVMPVQAQKAAAMVTVHPGSVRTAQNAIKGAQGLEQSVVGRGFKATLKETYKNLFKPAKGVPVDDVTFGGKPYTVDIGNKVLGKVISDTNLTAEKLALLECLPEVVRGGEYVGSGEYAQHGAEGKPVIRYDYFETPVSINGHSYIAKFDVEVVPGANNYRTHQVIKMDLTPAEASLVGPSPTASSETPSPVEGTRPLDSDVSIAQGAENVNPWDSVPVDGPEGRSTFPHLNRMFDEAGTQGSDGLGAADAGFDLYSRLQNQTGRFHPEGAYAARRVDVPAQDGDGRNVSRTASTIMGARAIPEDVVPLIERMVAEGALSYDAATDRAAMDRARRTVAEKTFAGAMEEFRSAVQEGRVSKDLTALGQVLLNNAANSRDGDAAAELLSLYQAMGTNAGQAVQAMSMFRKLDPESQLYGIRRTVGALNGKLGRDKGIQLDPALEAEFLAQTDQAGRDAVMRRIYQNAADQVPATWRDKWNAWRYLSMLGNPRTHVRNILGNVGFQPLRVVKNEIAAGIEAAFSAAGAEVERTKSFGASPALYRAAWNDYAHVAKALDGSKYTDARGEIEAMRRIFESDILEGARRGNRKALELEDVVFKRVTYADALAGYLKAHGETAARLERGEVDGALLSKARDYAGKEALKATYQDRNAISDRTVKIANSLGVLGEAILPFKRTPANILSRALEYSPAGFVKSVYDGLRGEKSLSEAIDGAAAGLTGTGLMALGAYLFAAGLVTGSQGDGEEDKWAQLLGHQGYALELPDGTSVTLDWLAPESLPFFMGVELMSAVGENGFQAQDIVDALGQVAEPMLDLSMLQSVNDLIDSVTYADTNKLGAMAASALVSYFSQAVPTLGGQLERIGQDVRMTTYTDRNNAAVPTDVQYALGKASAKIPIPGFDYQQIPYIDAWGREEESGDLLTRILINSVSPAYISQVEVDQVEAELQRIADATGDTGVFPARAGRYFTVNGERKDLTAGEYVKYAKALGKGRYELARQAMDSDAYAALDDAGKAAFISKMYQVANAKAMKRTVSSYSYDDEMRRYMEAEREGITPAEFYAYKEATGGLRADKDEHGNSVSGSKKEKVVAAIARMDLSPTEKDWLYLLNGYAEKDLPDMPWR